MPKPEQIAWDSAPPTEAELKSVDASAGSAGEAAESDRKPVSIAGSEVKGLTYKPTADSKASMLYQFLLGGHPTAQGHAEPVEPTTAAQIAAPLVATGGAGNAAEVAAENAADLPAAASALMKFVKHGAKTVGTIGAGMAGLHFLRKE